MTFDETKKLILNIVSGLTMNELPHGNWDIGGVFINEVAEELAVSGKQVIMYSVNYVMPILDDVDVVEVGSFFSFEAAMPCAIQTCIHLAIQSVQDSDAENDYTNHY